MLKPNNNLGKITRRIIVLHIFISCVFLKQTVFAYSNEKIALDFNNKGYAAQQQGNFSKALIFYKKALTLGLKDANTFNNIGIVCEKEGLIEKAKNYYLMAIEMDAYFLPAYTNIAYLYKDIGQEDLAFKYFMKRFELASDNDYWTQKVKKELLDMHPEHEMDIMLRGIEKLDKEVVDAFKDETDSNIRKSYEHYIKGQEYFSGRKYKKALKEFDQALFYMPNNEYILLAKRRTEIRLNYK